MAYAHISGAYKQTGNTVTKGQASERLFVHLLAGHTVASCNTATPTPP